MVKKKRNQLDFDRLRLATIEALENLSPEKNKDGLVEYLCEQAQQKPNAFLNLLIKLAQLSSFTEDKCNKITRIELVVPKDTIEDLNNDTKETFE